MDKYLLLPLLLLLTLHKSFGNQTKAICDVCTCTGTTISCRESKLKRSFNTTEWLAKGTPNYTEAIFDFNHIGHLIRLPTLPLVRLSYKGNRIVKIDDKAFKNLTSLEELDLSSNELTSGNLNPMIFEGPYNSEYYEPLNLKLLDLSDNELHTLHQDLFEHLPLLERLYLKHNPFRILDKPTVIAISSLPNLQILDLSFTKIKSLPEGFLHTPRKLHELVLKGNFFTEIPSDVLAESHDLRILNLNENPIKVISSERPFPLMSTLEQLHISFMPNLTRIEDGAFSGLINLDYLYCRMNEKLTFISPKAFSTLEHRPEIIKLDLSDNALKYLDKDFLRPVWTKIKQLNILGNPLVCDCENQWIVSELIPIMLNIHSPVEGLECAEPSAMKGMRLHSLQAKNYTMRCLDLFDAHPENDGPILISVFVIVILSLILALILVVWFKNNNTCRKGGQVNYQRAFYHPTRIEDPDKY